jgi:hypothetical protein
MNSFCYKHKHISHLEKTIILDNRKKYFNSIANEPLFIRTKKKIRYVLHINRKKKVLLL